MKKCKQFLSVLLAVMMLVCVVQVMHAGATNLTEAQFNAKLSENNLQ